MVKIMYLSPVAHYGGHDEIFAEMAAENKLPGTEVHVCSFPDSIGKFSHIEYRSYEGIVTAGSCTACCWACCRRLPNLLVWYTKKM